MSCGRTTNTSQQKGCWKLEEDWRCQKWQISLPPTRRPDQLRRRRRNERQACDRLCGSVGEPKRERPLVSDRSARAADPRSALLCGGPPKRQHQSDSPVTSCVRSSLLPLTTLTDTFLDDCRKSGRPCRDSDRQAMTALRLSC